MKFVHIFFFFVICCPLLSAQFGGRLQYSHSTVTSGDDAVEQSYEPGIYVGLNYWYRLKNIRLEFFPEIGYQRSFEQYKGALISEYEKFGQLNLIGISVPVQIYPFDFLSDCDCPTFSKQSRTFQKGFFVLASGGHFLATRNNNAFDYNTTVLTLGIGFDIGINDLITISPLAEHVWYLRDQRDNYPIVREGWRAGIRVSFRPDY